MRTRYFAPGAFDLMVIIFAVIFVLPFIMIGVISMDSVIIGILGVYSVCAILKDARTR